MEPHPTTTGGRRRRRRDRGAEAPIDAAWVERKALAYTSRFEATRRGVAQLLERKIREQAARRGEDPEEALALVPAAVDGLVERGFVDDRRAATQWTDRWRREGRSKAWIRMKLAQKGVPEAIARERLAAGEGEGEGDDDLRAAWQTARRRRLGPHCADPGRRRADRERHLAALARRGFSLDVARRVIDAESVEAGEAMFADDAGVGAPLGFTTSADDASDPEDTR